MTDKEKEKAETKRKAEELLRSHFKGENEITDEKLIDIINEIKKDKPLNNLFEKFKKSYKFFVDFDDNGEKTEKNFFRYFKISSPSELNINPEEITSKYSPLEMFLISILWKQGDFGKEQRILDGIKKNEIIPTVFPQFGRFLKTLSDENHNDEPNYENIEPIIDQHSLRAFCFSKDIEYNEGRDPSYDVYDKYIKWYKSVIRNCKCEDKELCFLMLNEIMFILGKALKK